MRLKDKFLGAFTLVGTPIFVIFVVGISGLLLVTIFHFWLSISWWWVLVPVFILLTIRALVFFLLRD